jgi:hypothetical protein
LYAFMFSPPISSSTKITSYEDSHDACFSICHPLPLLKSKPCSQIENSCIQVNGNKTWRTAPFCLLKYPVSSALHPLPPDTHLRLRAI